MKTNVCAMFALLHRQRPYRPWAVDVLVLRMDDSFVAGEPPEVSMTVDDHGASVAQRTAATTTVGTVTAAVAARRGWAVVNLDRQYQNTVLVTRWRWYAAWWAASLRLFDGDDMKIVRTGRTPAPRRVPVLRH